MCIRDRDALEDLGIGSIGFTALAQGLLTGRYLDGVPSDSRAAQGKSLSPDWLSDRMIGALRGLNDLAARRDQTLAQMAIAWCLRGGRLTTALIGASRPEQVVDCVGALTNLDFTPEELSQIDALTEGGDVNLWARSSEGAGEG